MTRLTSALIAAGLLLGGLLTVVSPASAEDGGQYSRNGNRTSQVDR